MADTRIWFRRKKKAVDPEPEKPDKPTTFDYIFKEFKTECPVSVKENKETFKEVVKKNSI